MWCVLWLLRVAGLPPYGGPSPWRPLGGFRPTAPPCAGTPAHPAHRRVRPDPGGHAQPARRPWGVVAVAWPSYLSQNLDLWGSAGLPKHVYSATKSAVRVSQTHRRPPPVRTDPGASSGARGVVWGRRAWPPHVHLGPKMGLFGRFYLKLQGHSVTPAPKAPPTAQKEPFRGFGVLW